MSLVSNVLPPKKHTMGVSMHSLVRRVPMALGPLIGGYLIAAFGEVEGVRAAFIVAVVFGFISLVTQQVLIDEPAEGSEGKKEAEASPRRMFGMMSPDLRNLLVSDILVRFCEQIPYAFAVVWAVKVVGVSTVQFGWLTVIEMVTAMAIYIPVAYWVGKTSTKKPFVVMTFIFFTAFPLVLLFADSFLLLVLAFIVRGLKEFGEPTRKSLIMDLAPERRKAGMFGLYYLIRDVVVSMAAFGGAFLWEVSPQVNFLTAFGFGVLGTIYFGVFGKDLGGEDY
jgi:MFS family permease